MKDMIINVLTNEVTEVEISEDEKARREADATKAREEESKPQPPTVEDQLVFLKQRDAQIQDDNNLIIEAMINAGLI